MSVFIRSRRVRTGLRLSKIHWEKRLRCEGLKGIALLQRIGGKCSARITNRNLFEKSTQPRTQRVLRLGALSLVVIELTLKTRRQAPCRGND